MVYFESLPFVAVRPEANTLASRATAVVAIVAIAKNSDVLSFIKMFFIQVTKLIKLIHKKSIFDVFFANLFIIGIFYY